MKRYLPQLDGLRTIAVGLVICIHIQLLPTGYVGVDIFFVLSGYLITTILLEERDSGHWSIRTFYMRRLRRLYPALLVLLGVAGVAAPGWMLGTGLHRFLLLLLAATYLMDVPGTIHFGWTLAIGHTWSLAVEEQFYLVWPLFLKRVKALWPVIAACGVMLTLLAAGPLAFTYAPFARGGVLLIGCVLAFETYRHPVSHPGRLTAGGLVVLALVVWQGTPAGQQSGMGLTDIGAGIGSAALIAGMIQGGIVARVLALPPLVWLGKRSYGIYLWHFLIGFYVFDHWAAPATSARVTVVVVGAVLMASLSYEIVEKRFRSHRPVVAADPLHGGAGALDVHRVVPDLEVTP